MANSAPQPEEELTNRLRKIREKFRRAIKRINKLNQFATKIGDQFDINELDIYKLTI